MIRDLVVRGELPLRDGITRLLVSARHYDDDLWIRFNEAEDALALASEERHDSDDRVRQVLNPLTRRPRQLALAYDHIPTSTQDLFAMPFEHHATARKTNRPRGVSRRRGSAAQSRRCQVGVSDGD